MSAIVHAPFYKNICLHGGYRVQYVCETPDFARDVGAR